MESGPVLILIRNLLLNILLFDVNMFGAFRRAIGEGHIERTLVVDTSFIRRPSQGRMWRVMEMDIPRARAG
jgi:hypothetical protein